MIAGASQVTKTMRIAVLVNLAMQGLLAAGSSPSSVTLTGPRGPSVFGQDVTLSATVSPADADGRVTFYDGAAMLGIRAVSAGQASITLSLLPSGTRSLRAYYGGNDKYAPGSSSVTTLNVAVRPANAFSAAVNSPLGAKPGPFVAADFNGDGKADLAIVTGDNVSVLLGNGDGTFQPMLSYAAGAGATYIAAGDFNGDGATDLVVPAAAGVMILLGNGDGTLRPAVNSAAGVPPGPVAVADFNGDGVADLAINTNLLTVLLGNGDGSFGPVHNFCSTRQIPPSCEPQTSSGSIVVADFNVDGKVDVTFNGLMYLGSGDGTFQPAILLETVAEVAGDFNGDGIPDVAEALWGSANLPIPFFLAGVRVDLGNGDGTFHYAESFFPGAGSSTTGFIPIAVGDFDGDGKLDLVVSANGEKVFFGNGDGTFNLQRFDANSSSSPFAVGEFTGDGRTDLAIFNDASVSVVPGKLLSVSVTSLTSSLSPSLYGQTVMLTANLSPPDVRGNVFFYPVPGDLYPSSLGSAAVTHGQAVLTLNNLAPGSYSVRAEYQGDLPTYGVWSPIVTQTVNPPQPTINLTSSASPASYGQSIRLTAMVSPSIAHGAVTFKDGALTLGSGVLSAGRADLVVSTLTAGSHTLTASFPGDQFVPGVSTLLTQTVNSGLPSIEMLSSSANPATFGRSVTLTGVLPSDATGNVTFYDGTSTLGNGTVAKGQALFTTSLLASGMHSLKFYYSGDAKYVPGTSNSLPQSVNALPGNGFYQLTSYATQRPVNAVVVGDFNRDGIADIAISQDDASVSVFPGNGDGTFQPAVNYATGGYTTAGSLSCLAAGDFNGDGIPDLAMARLHDATVSVLLGNGDGTFGPVVNYDDSDGDPQFSVSVAVGDFNGDGRNDLAIAADDGNGGRILLLLGNGDGTFQPPTTIRDASFRSLAVADFNGDGKADLALADVNVKGVSLFLGNGDATFHKAANAAAGNGPVSLAVGDFNNDGKVDIAVANYTDNNVSVLLGNGDGTFQAAVNYAAGVSPNEIAVGDFNGDGYADLAVANQLGTSLLLGRGDGTFAPSATLGSVSNAVAVGDFNADGVPDVVIGTNAGIELFLGQSDSRRVSRSRR